MMKRATTKRFFHSEIGGNSQLKQAKAISKIHSNYYSCCFEKILIELRGMVDGNQLENAIVTALSEVFLNASAEDASAVPVEGLDHDLISYIAGMLSSTIIENDHHSSNDDTTIDDVLIPFLESLQCPDHMIERARNVVETVIDECCYKNQDHNNSIAQTSTDFPISNNENRKLQQGIVKMSLLQDDFVDQSKQLWSMDSTTTVKAMANDLIDAHHDKTSMRDKRKQRKLVIEQERKALSSKNDSNIDEGDGGGLVHMNVRTFSNNTSSNVDKTRDVQVRNVTVSLNNGTTLLESGELKFSYQRRYGLIGENGVGMSSYLSSSDVFC
jgi:hypothetical protein